MHVENYLHPKSSFLSVDKDMNLIVSKILKNERLQKLLYYTTEDAMSRPALTEEQRLELLGKNIKIVPKVYVDGSVLAYVIISFDNFSTNMSNPEFRDNTISFDIICHYDQWRLKDFELRPYRIAAELDYMLDKQKLTGIGRLEFMGANQLILSDEYAGISLIYQAIHGGEDKVGMPNPVDQEQFVKDYHKIFNND